MLNKIEEAKEKILTELKKNGPSHLSALQKKLDIPYGTIRLAVDLLLQKNQITDKYKIIKGVSRRIIQTS